MNLLKKLSFLDWCAIILGVVLAAMIVTPNIRRARKPVIYLYSPEPIEVSISLDVDGIITETIPEYENSWQVKTTPDGTIVKEHNFVDSEGNEISETRKFRYLYYEADIAVESLPDEGWSVEKNALEPWMTTNLAKIGFNNREIRDFKDYWLAALNCSNFYNIYIMPDDFLEEKLRLDIYPEPDSVLRKLFYFEGTDRRKLILPPAISPFEREGFVLVEWGGILQ